MHRLILCLLLLLPAPVSATPELHFVGVRDGSERTDGQSHWPRADVLVDRPGQEVILVLSNLAPLLWRVEATEGTTVLRIVLVGRQAERTTVELDGVAIDPEVWENSDAFHSARAGMFLRLVPELPDRFGLSQAASFTGMETADTRIVVREVEPDNPLLFADPLAASLDPARVPDGLRPLLTRPVPRVDLEFTEDGFLVQSPVGAHLFEVSLDVPSIQSPAGAAYDTNRPVIYGVSGDTWGPLLYSYNWDTDVWRLRAELLQRRGGQAVFDGPGDRLIILSGDLLQAWLRVTRFDPETEVLQEVNVDRDGLAVVRRYAGTPFRHRVLGIEGDQMLIGVDYDRAERDDRQPFELFLLVDVATGAVIPVQYADE